MGPLHLTYAERMKNHPYGFALYKPTSSNILKPGSVGYFDGSGFWNPITDLSDKNTLKRHGFSEPSELCRAPREEIKGWGPKVSTKVNSYTGDFSGGVDGSLTLLPAEASVQWKYKITSDFGAVLVTAAPVIHEAFYYESPFRNWVKQNGRALLNGPLAEEIKSHGLFVVTQTYATARCSLTAWQNPSSEVFLGFDIGMTGIGELGPHGGWYEGKSDSGWNHFEAKDDELKVVFAGGLWFNKRIGSHSRLDLAVKPRSRSSTPYSISIPISGEASAPEEVSEPIFFPHDETAGEWDDVEGTFLDCERFGVPPEEAQNEDDDDEDYGDEEEQTIEVVVVGPEGETESAKIDPLK